MIKPILFFLLLSALKLSAQRDTISYALFEKTDLVAEHCEVILIVRSPQTEQAEKIGGKIYTEESDLRFLQQSFYRQSNRYENPDGSITITHSPCGYDLYFYLKKDGNITEFSVLNSECEATQSGLEFLATHGRTLKADTLKRYFPKGIRSRKQLRRLFENAVYTEYSNGFTASTPYESITKSFAYIPSYYDGHATISIPFDTLLSPREQIEKEIGRMRVINVPDDKINWSVTPKFYESWTMHVLGSPFPSTLEFYVLFTDEFAGIFRDLPGFTLYPAPRKALHDLDSPILIWK